MPCPRNSNWNPNKTTTALIVHNKQAKCFNVREFAYAHTWRACRAHSAQPSASKTGRSPFDASLPEQLLPHASCARIEGDALPRRHASENSNNKGGTRMARITSVGIRGFAC